MECAHDGRGRWLLFLGVLLALAQGLPDAHAGEHSALAERLQLCSSCHNPDGNSTVPDNPKLAALDAGYLARQMADFKSGARQSAIMSGIISQVQEQEYKPLAKYFSEQKAMPGIEAVPQQVARGKEIFDEGLAGSAVPACSGCHNEDGSGSDKYPRLTGQHAPYVVKQLQNFKTGVRANDSKAVMQAVARRMTDDEIQAVADYVATLKETEE